MLPLWLLKCSSAALITVSSAAGLWAPLTGLASVHTTSGKHALAFANCVAASMLTTMAMVHLLPEALVTHTPVGDAHAHAHAHVHSGGVYAAEHAAVTRTLLWALVGMLVPAMLDHVMSSSSSSLAGSEGGIGSHGHSHGALHGHSHHRRRHEHAVQQQQQQQQQRDDTATAAAAAVRHTPPSAAAHVTTTLVLLLLMCFHNVLEGVILGLERSAASLLNTLLPLVAHKFFDGVVVGVSLVKQRQLTQSATTLADAPARSSSRGSDDASTTRHAETTPLLHKTTATTTTRATAAATTAVAHKTHDAHAGDTTTSSMWSCGIVAWLLLTPLTLLLTARLYHTAVRAGGALPGASMRDGAPALSAVNAAASGSFVYVGLSLLVQEEAKSARNVAAMVLGAVTTYGLTLAEHHGTG